MRESFMPLDDKIKQDGELSLVINDYNKNYLEEWKDHKPYCAGLKNELYSSEMFTNQ